MPMSLPVQIPGKHDNAEVARLLSKFMKEKHYKAGECLTEVNILIGGLHIATSRLC